MESDSSDNDNIYVASNDGTDDEDQPEESEKDSFSKSSNFCSWIDQNKSNFNNEEEDININ
jgi:hypothetical protein